MAQGTVTPLQLTAASALLQNQGINGLPAALTSSLSDIDGTTLFTNFTTAVTAYIAQSFATEATLASLLAIGSTTIPALGNSIPSAYTNITPTSEAPWGFTGLIDQTGNAYLGDGDVGKFCQGFMAVQGYLNTVNQFINSSVNVQTYLGPTFTSMDALVTNNISNLNPNFSGFALDLAQQGVLWNPANMAAYGTPAGLLQQLAAVGRFAGGFFGGLQSKLIEQGLTPADIKQLLRGQEQLSTTQFNRLQQSAYNAMTTVTGDALAQVMAILDVSLPNINTMADLLNPIKTFPRSYKTLYFPVGTVWQPIYNPDTSVNVAVAPTVAALLPAASGCEELGKIIPPGQAAANKAVQIGFQQITGLPLTTVPQLAEVVQGVADRNWDPTISYLADAVVNYGDPISTVYRAQQNVPVGVDITNTSYWLPTTLGGLNTMSGLPLIEAQTTPVASSVTTYFANDQATGSGPNGTITTCDVIGLAIDYNDFSTLLVTAKTNIDSLQTAGALAALNTAFLDIASAANEGQAIGHIADANNAIAAIQANVTYASQVSALQSAWTAMAEILSQEKSYQTQASLDYFNLQAGEQSSIMGFVLQLPQYGQQVDSCGACEFLEGVADTTTLGGQAIVGAMREGRNNQRLNSAQIGQDTTPSNQPAVTPVPAVNPVY